MKGRNVKQVMLKEGNSGRRRVNKEGKEGRTWLRYCLFMYEHGALKTC
jgi:hypothetical protein